MNVEVVVRVVPTGKHGDDGFGSASRRGSTLSYYVEEDESKDHFDEDGIDTEKCVTVCNSSTLRSGFKVFDVDAITEVDMARCQDRVDLEKLFQSFIRPVVQSSHQLQRTGLVMIQGCAHHDDFVYVLHQIVASCLHEAGRNIPIRLTGTEVWNETTRDLIAPETQEDQVLASKGSSVKIRAPEDVLGLAALLLKRRRRARGQRGFVSHMIVSLTWGKGCGLDLVDLAEAHHGASQEMRCIKKSRLALEKVICALNSANMQRGGHIPFRDSKLTRMLQPTLLQPSRVLLLATVGQSMEESIGTLSTLEFCNNIRRGKRQRRNSSVSLQPSQISNDVESVSSRQSFSTLASADVKSLGLPVTTEPPEENFSRLQRDNRAKARLINILASETVGKGDAIKSLVEESRDKQQALENAQNEVAAQREIIMQMRGQIEEQQLRIEQLAEQSQRYLLVTETSKSAAAQAHRDADARIADLEAANERLMERTANSAEEYTIKLKQQLVSLDKVSAELSQARAEQAAMRVEHEAVLHTLRTDFNAEKAKLKREAVELAHECQVLEQHHERLVNECRLLEDDHSRFQVEVAAHARSALCAEMRAVVKARKWQMRARAWETTCIAMLRAALKSQEGLRSDLRTVLGIATAIRFAFAISLQSKASTSDQRQEFKAMRSPSLDYEKELPVVLPGDEEKKISEGDVWSAPSQDDSDICDYSQFMDNVEHAMTVDDYEKAMSLQGLDAASLEDDELITQLEDARSMQNELDQMLELACQSSLVESVDMNEGDSIQQELESQMHELDAELEELEIRSIGSSLYISSVADGDTATSNIIGAKNPDQIENSSAKCCIETESQLEIQGDYSDVDKEASMDEDKVSCLEDPNDMIKASCEEYPDNFVPTKEKEGDKQELSTDCDSLVVAVEIIRVIQDVVEEVVKTSKITNLSASMIVSEKAYGNCPQKGIEESIKSKDSSRCPEGDSTGKYHTEGASNSSSSGDNIREVDSEESSHEDEQIQETLTCADVSSSSVLVTNNADRMESGSFGATRSCIKTPLSIETSSIELFVEEEARIEQELLAKVENLENTIRDRDATIESLERLLLSDTIEEDFTENDQDSIASGSTRSAEELQRLQQELASARHELEVAHEERKQTLQALERKSAVISQLSLERNQFNEDKSSIQREAFNIISWLQREDDRKSKLIAALLKEKNTAPPVFTKPTAVSAFTPVENPFLSPPVSPRAPEPTPKVNSVESTQQREMRIPSPANSLD